MIVKQWVEVSQEVDIEIGREAILAAFSETPDAGETWFVVLNRFALCLNALPDATIATWKPAQRKSIYNFLSQQSERFHEPTQPLGVEATP